MEAIADLHELKAAYAAATDAKYTPDRQRRPKPEFVAAAARQAACFTHDAVWRGGPFGGDIVGRAALQSFFEQSPWRFTTHLYAAPILEIEGETARGTWRLWELGVQDTDQRTVLLTGATHETYRLTSEGWRIASMRFETLHSLVLSSEPDAVRRLIPSGEAA
jgi:hypothetical protein